MLTDFSSLPYGGKSYGGSDTKRSVLFVDGSRWLIKLADVNDGNELPPNKARISNAPVSEHIACRVIRSIGLEAQETILGTWDGHPAVACKDFMPDGNWDLHEFVWFLNHQYPNAYNIRVMPWEYVRNTLDNNKILAPIREPAWERFYDTFVIDALIGNFDRHKNNFGYLYNRDSNSIMCAPVYDCGSSLFPALSDEGIKAVISDPSAMEERVHVFPKAALSKTDNLRKPDKFGYLEFLTTVDDPRIKDSLSFVLDSFNQDLIDDIINTTPNISDVRKEFYSAMIKMRKELILERAFVEINNSPGL